MEKKIDNMEKIIKNNNEEIVNKYLDNITKEYGYEIDKQCLKQLLILKIKKKNHTTGTTYN